MYIISSDSMDPCSSAAQVPRQLLGICCALLSPHPNSHRHPLLHQSRAVGKYLTWPGNGQKAKKVSSKPLGRFLRMGNENLFSAFVTPWLPLSWWMSKMTPKKWHFIASFSFTQLHCWEASFQYTRHICHPKPDTFSQDLGMGCSHKREEAQMNFLEVLRTSLAAVALRGQGISVVHRQFLSCLLQAVILELHDPKLEKTRAQLPRPNFTC